MSVDVSKPWAQPASDVLTALDSSTQGLTESEADRRLSQRPPDATHRASGWVATLAKQFTSPIVLILIAATVLSMALGDSTDGVIIILIIAASGLLGFAQDFRAGRDVAALMARVQVLAEVRRSGRVVQIPVAHVIAGDVVLLEAGSLIPADCRLLESSELLVDESTLTGESFPAEKRGDAVVTADALMAERSTIVHFGTHVVSGSATAVAYAVGRDTELGTVAHDLREARRTTSYERGITRFGYLLVRVMLLLTTFIFIVNTLFGRPFVDSLLFSLALAVGLTPQMLPAIVTISLSTGARLLARQQVIVKRLEVIEDFGAMSVLCTDKTGTLTLGAPALDHALDLDGQESEDVLVLAALNAGLQSTFANPMDRAILQRTAPPADAKRHSEVPYDFSRKRLSVLTDHHGEPTLITKGAYDSVIGVCTTARMTAGHLPIEAVRAQVDALFEKLSADGFRVLALAVARRESEATLSPADEHDLTLVGLLAFHDPVKPGVPEAIDTLRRLGVSLRLVTGDNRLAAAAAGRQVGLATANLLSGPEIDQLNDTDLAGAVRDVEVFADVEPHHKRRIVMAVRANGAGTGFLGDGINDAPALHAADVGISVDTAVDVAREAAGVVLLAKDLKVVINGVRTGRQTFANTLKYARLTTSANFGNMVSMAAASLFLPFLPLLPRQLLLLNFLTDIPSTAIASDQVDPEQVESPARWDLREIARFMFVFGAVSTFFDLCTFAVLRWGVDASATEFRSAWFVESSVSELLVIFSLRTSRAAWRSKPDTLLAALAIVTSVVIVAVPYLPLIADPLGLDALPQRLMWAVLGLVLAYVVTNEVAKRTLGMGRVSLRSAPGTPTAPRSPLP